LFKFLSRSQQAWRWGLAVIDVSLLTTLLHFPLSTWLDNLFNSKLPSAILFITLAGAVTAGLSFALRRWLPALLPHERPALIAVAAASAAIGLACQLWLEAQGLFIALGYSLAAALTFLVLLGGFVTLQEKLDRITGPAIWRGLPRQLLCAALAAMPLLALARIL
jgi:Na+-translocating ferredoxin:NAD+ oxidoreductase RnfA subunit